jgi:AraC family ethanolamine operon transcriptional activator
LARSIQESQVFDILVFGQLKVVRAIAKLYCATSLKIKVMSFQPASKSLDNVNVTQHIFRDPDALAEIINPACRITPLTLTPFSCEVVVVSLGEITFTFTHNATPMRAIGPKLADHVVFSLLLDDDDKEIVSHYHSMTANNLFGFDQGRPADIILRQRLLYGYAAIHVDLLNRYCSAMGRDDLDEEAWAKNLVSIPATIEPIRDFLRQLYGLAVNQKECLASPAFQHLLREDFLALLIQAIPPGCQAQSALPRPFRRAELAQLTEAFLEETLCQPITLAALSDRLFSSQRTLLYAFEQVLGTSPMAYLKVMRLQAVHRLLKAQDSPAKSISSIAADHGFYSHGHFSRDYKILFGERPKDTMNRTMGTRAMVNREGAGELGS